MYRLILRMKVSSKVIKLKLFTTLLSRLQIQIYDWSFLIYDYPIDSRVSVRIGLESKIQCY